MNTNADPLELPTQIDLSTAIMFRVPLSLANFLLACSILCGCLLPLLLCMPLLRPKPDGFRVVAICAPILTAVAIYLFRTSRRLRDSILVSFEGIVSLSRYRKPVSMRWSEVAAIDVHESQQRLVLRDAEGARKIRLEYQIQDISKLRDYVTSHATFLQNSHGAAPTVFHRSWYNKCVLLGGLAFFSYLALQAAGGPGSLAVFLGFAIACLVLVLRDPTTVEIKKQAVQITYPGWRRSIAFSDITGISLGNVHDRGNVWAVVTISSLRSKPTKLFRFREGSIALRDALQSAWKSAGGTSYGGDPKGAVTQ